MTPVAFIFPGQGAQYVGMGREFYESQAAARAVFDQADAILGNSLKDVIFNGPQEKLTLTAFCQPGILTCSIAALQSFQAHPKFKNISVQYTAGLSLGEYSALAASGVLSFHQALRLVERRAALMEEAARREKGTMAAIIGFPKERLLQICQDTGAQIANYNSPEQIVVTGHQAKVEAACAKSKEAGAKSVIPLEVSGAFHSSLMQPAADQFAVELKNFSFKPAVTANISNVQARPQLTPVEIAENLARQIVSPVRWEESVQYIAVQGVTHFMEMGPGKVLKGLIRRIDPALKVYTIETPADLDNLPF